MSHHSTLDPFAVRGVEDFQDLILQHLNGKEILNLFKVSPKWNGFASKSEVVMSKIWLNGRNYRRNQIGTLKYLLRSTCRGYQNVRLRKEFEQVVFKDFTDFIVNHSGTIVNLHLSANQLYDDCDDLELDPIPVPDGFLMPKLQYFETLMISFPSAFINACENIENLTVHDVITNQIMLTLKDKKKLKVLNCGDFYADGPELLDVKFKLESFGCFRLGNSGMNENIEAFFDMMAQTLTSLKISIVQPENFEIFWLLPNLQKLEIVDLNVTDEFVAADATPLPNIKVLKIRELTPQFKAFISSSLSTVKFLTIECFNHQQQDLDWIASNMKSLEDLKIWVVNQEEYNPSFRISFYHD